MGKVLAIVGGGAIGALLRYYVSLFFSNLAGGVFPLGTLVVNATGSFIIGLLWGFSEAGFIPPHMRIFVITGLLGAFTTFSTYSLETINLLRDNEIKSALLNIAISNISGIVLAYLGYTLSKYLYK